MSFTDWAMLGTGLVGAAFFVRGVRAAEISRQGLWVVFAGAVAGLICGLVAWWLR